MDYKTWLPLAGVIVGWLLGQGTTLSRDWWAARNLRKGLLTELEDVYAQTERLVWIHSRHLQLATIKAVENTVPLPVQAMFYEKFFKEAFRHLNREQRLSYQLIHGQLNNYNEQSGMFSKETREFYDEFSDTDPSDKKTEAIEKWGDRSKELYRLATVIRWHIRFHLDNRKMPKMDIKGAVHESYVKFLNELEEEIKKIMEGAKNLKPDAFRKIYDPTHFKKTLAPAE